MNNDRTNETIGKLWHELEDRLRIVFRHVDWECLPLQGDGQAYLDFFGIDDQGVLSVDFFVITQISVEGEKLDQLTSEDLRPLRKLARRIRELISTQSSPVDS